MKNNLVQTGDKTFKKSKIYLRVNNIDVEIGELDYRGRECDKLNVQSYKEHYDKVTDAQINIYMSTYEIIDSGEFSVTYQVECDGYVYFYEFSNEGERYLENIIILETV